MAGDFVVVGLGMFGRSVALSLARMGQSVLGIDRSESIVQSVADEIDRAVCVDATDEQALAELPLRQMSCAVVAIGTESLESSILATALLAQMGLPKIVARSVGDLHARVLRAVGAHQVINPEVELGRRLALSLSQPNVLERVELGDQVEIAEIEVPDSFVSRSLVDLDVRRRFGTTVVALRRDERVLAGRDVLEPLRAGDIMVIIGPREAIAEMAAIA
jgi:trk system potassium uptake protein TrkA